MRELTKRCLSILMVCAVVGAGTVAFINLDQGPEPVQQYGPVEESEAIAPIVAYGAGAATVAVAGCLATECWVQEADLPEEKVDATETHGEVYKSAQTTTAQVKVLQDTTSNWQTQTQNAYRRAGKTAYVRALSEGATKTAAVTAAKQAVLHNYSRQQIQLLTSLEAQAEATVASWETVAGEQNLSGTDVFVRNSRSAAGGWEASVTDVYLKNFTTTLANGSSYEYTSIHVAHGGSDDYAIDKTKYMVGVKPPESLANAGASREVLIDMGGGSGYGTMFDEYQSQAQTVASNVESFAQETYDAWSAGQIDKTDLIDPYMGARDFAPDRDQGQAWTQKQLLSLGITPPENFSSIDRMTIRDETNGILYRGTLMSGGVPPGGSYETGTTYNASEISGVQFVLTRTQQRELTGEFTLINATTVEGEPVNSLDYTNPNLNTTSLKEFKQAMDEYRKFREEIEAREERMRNSSGGGGLLDGAGDWIPGLNGIQSVVALIVALFAVLFGLRVVAGN